MLEQSSFLSFLSAGAGLAQVAVPFAPVVLVVLCIVAAAGTVLLLPSRRESPLRKVGALVLLSAGLIFAALLVRWSSTTAGGGMGVFFWLFSTVALIGAVRVVTHTRPVYSALYFVLTVFATAGLFVLLWAEFLAAALVLIYAGAILITYLFVIMLAAEAVSEETAAGPVSHLAEHDIISRDPVAACVVGFTLMGLILFVIFDRPDGLRRASAAAIAPVDDAPAPPMVVGAAQELGAYLFQRHLLSLELTGLILTVGMIGAIIIARRRVSVAPAEEMPGALPMEEPTEVVVGPATPLSDDPHSIPVFGTTNPRQKEYPEN